MSNLSTNSRPIVSNTDFQNHTNSRPKFQPIRVKELLHFCESDDDESEDKPQESSTDSDTEEPQPLPQDDEMEDDFNKSLTFHNTIYKRELKVTCKVPHTINSLKPDELLLMSMPVEHKSENKCSTSHEYVHAIENESNMKNEQVSQMQLDIESDEQETTFQGEDKNKFIINKDIKRQSGDKLIHKSDCQSLDQQGSCRIDNNSEPVVLTSQYFEDASQITINNLQDAVMKTDERELKAEINEDKINQENTSNKLLSLDVGSFTNCTDQWILQTPLKHAPVSSIRPDPCFSRRNINQTPQNKLSAINKSHGLTPATSLSHWSQNTVKQTPLQDKCISFKNCIQTPTNSVYFISNIGRHETPRYLNMEGRIRKPLADTTGSAQNDSSSRPLLQGLQLSKVNVIVPQVQNKLSNKDISNKPCLPKQIFEASEIPPHVESNMNEELKESKHLNIENSLLDKGTINEVLNSAYVSQCTKNNKEMLKSVCNLPQNQNVGDAKQNQQEELKKCVDNVPNVQFLMPSTIPKTKQTRTLFVKGKEYLILGTLGQGMSGEVLRVQDLLSLELCAIKCVNLNRMDKDSAQGCLEEISMLHKLQAPCVVKMIDYEINYPMVYVVMEMGDTDLSRLLKAMSQEKQIPLTMILYYWTEMLTAVKHIHDNGVIHSDLKPANFLLVRGRLKLIDFGIASSMNSDMTSVVKNCPIGTLNYISPEALMDIGGDSPTRNVKYKISFKSDVWSLGCILYSLVYGHTPFHHIRSQWAKVNAITNPRLNINFPTTLPSTDGNKNVLWPPVLIDVMRNCLQHDPKARPTVAELLQIDYIPTKQEHMSTPLSKIPANTLVKIKHSLSEDEWRQLIWILENRRYT